MLQEKSAFKFNIVDDVDYLVDEKNNSHISFRLVSWGDREPKLELRKWTIKADGTEQPLKGCTFLTEEGPHELARVLTHAGFGHTDEILTELSTREDFKTALNGIVGEDSEFFDKDAGLVEDEFYDPEDDDHIY